jgi:hypothetical protein
VNRQDARGAKERREKTRITIEKNGRKQQGETAEGIPLVDLFFFPLFSLLLLALLASWRFAFF